MPADHLAHAIEAQLRGIIMGFRATQLVHVAARLGLADQLAAGRRAPDEIAEAVLCDEDALRRAMRALAALGLMIEDGDGRFSLTAMGELLRTDHPTSLRGMAALYGEPWMWHAYGALLQGVRSGSTPFLEVHDESFFRYLESRPLEAATFNAAMSGFSSVEAAAVADACQLSAMSHVVDVGGGHGVLLVELLRRNAHLRGTLFERPRVVVGAASRMRAAGFGARCDFVEGDFFCAVEPAGADLYLLKSVLHDWQDAQVLRILQRCRAAMTAPHARLYVIERVLPEPGDPSAPEAKLFDINMFVTAGGRERSAAEYEALLNAAGLRMTGIVPTAGPLSVIRAERG